MKRSLKKKQLIKNKLLRNILSALTVAVLGFILLNLTFIFDAIYQGAIRWIIGLFISLDPNMELNWFPPLMHGSFVVVIALISWFVFRSKLKPLFKAVYMTVPVAVVIATLGMLLYRWPMVLYPLGFLLSAGTLYCFHKTKQPWIYYYTVILVALALAIFTLLGGEI